MPSKKKAKATGQKATLVLARPLAGGSVWELNLYVPKVRGQRTDLKVNGNGESPLPAADRELARQSLKVAWTEADGHWFGDVFTV
jgi:hypothetical protein